MVINSLCFVMLLFVQPYSNVMGIKFTISKDVARGVVTLDYR